MRQVKEDTGTVSALVSTSYACNLACTYCFQKDTPAFTKMRDATRDAALEWIVRRVDERACHTLHVHFFGADHFSFRDRVRLQEGDVMAVSFQNFGRPLRNPLQIDRTPPALMRVRAL